MVYISLISNDLDGKSSENGLTETVLLEQSLDFLHLITALDQRLHTFRIQLHPRQITQLLEGPVIAPGVLVGAAAG